jgi:hypothetical protein
MFFFFLTPSWNDLTKKVVVDLNVEITKRSIDLLIVKLTPSGLGSLEALLDVC